jgi:hypothetical protein
MLRNILLALMLSVLFVGCATNVTKGVQINEADLAKYDVMTPEEVIVSYKSLLADAQAIEMPFYAPHYYQEANKALASAEQDFKKNKKKHRMVQYIAKGESILAKGKRIMVDVKKRLAKEFASKTILDKIGAKQIYPKDYESVIDDLSDLIEKIELDDAGKISKDQKELLTAMLALEVKTIKYNALHAADKIISKADDNDAEKFAPKTFSEAKTVYAQSSQRISKEPRNDAVVVESAAQAMFAAKHLEHVLHEVRGLEARYKKSPEALILEEELRLKKIADALAHDDVRDRSLNRQSETLATAAALLQEQQGQQKNILDKNNELISINNAQKSEIETLKQSIEKNEQESLKKDERIVRLSAQLIQLDSELKATQTKAEDTGIVENTESSPDQSVEAESEEPEVVEPAVTEPETMEPTEAAQETQTQ